MSIIPTVTAAALLAAGGATAAMAQTPTPSPAPTGPSSASSPHQREATQTGTYEAPATNGANPSEASSPHQRGAMGDASKADLDTAMTEGATPKTFVMTAGQDGMTEIALAKLALQKSSNSEVKQFAEKMQRDHEQADQQLSSLAKSKGLNIPAKLDAKHEAMVKSMSAKSGEAFDASYSQHMAKAHAKAVALFQGAEKSSDADISAFAKKTLPTLEEHKQLADNLRESVGTRTASAAEEGKAREK